jgi:hypothetical protein
MKQEANIFKRRIISLDAIYKKSSSGKSNTSHHFHPLHREIFSFRAGSRDVSGTGMDITFHPL